MDDIKGGIPQARHYTVPPNQRGGLERKIPIVAKLISIHKMEDMVRNCKDKGTDYSLWKTTYKLKWN